MKMPLAVTVREVLALPLPLGCENSSRILEQRVVI